MKKRGFLVVLLFIVLITIPGNAEAWFTPSVNQTALIFVDLSSPDSLNRFTSTFLPIYFLFDSGLLTAADQTDQLALRSAGLVYYVLDPELHNGTYYLATTHPSRPSPDFASYARVLLKTADGFLLSVEPDQVDVLSQAGVELVAITLTPKPLPEAQPQVDYPQVVVPDPIIHSMIDQVTQAQVYTYNRQLAGELPVMLNGSDYVITTRNTNSGTPIQKATQFIGQHLQNLGMNVEYHQWGGASYPNVIGQITGSVDPEDIYIIGAHLDDVSNTPGADDNASGSAATLMAADILSQYSWGCTLRFALWTGEEQGLHGSAAYAKRSYNYGENIRGYLNLDMIAYNTVGSSPAIDLIYKSSLPATYAMAQLFAGVIDAYDINLIPGLGTSLGGGSDHMSFWTYGYPAILSIEDQADLNPYFHTHDDTPAKTDPEYFTNFVKAAIGSFAHLTGCLVTSNYGYLDGHITGNGSPIAGAAITAEDSLGHYYSTLAEVSGYYNMTLPANTYLVTASANRFIFREFSGVEISPSATTRLDFSLQPGLLFHLPIIYK